MKTEFSDSIHSEYILSLKNMKHTAIPSIKGQITIPSSIREKYKISKDTPIVIKDKGKGVIEMKVMRMIEDNDIEYYENEKEFGLHFKKGIDTKVLINAIKKIDG